jgi:hypothetical protein
VVEAGTRQQQEKGKGAPVLSRHRILGVALSVALLLVLSASEQAKGAGIALMQDTNKDAGTTTLATLGFNSNNTAGNWIGVCIRAGAVNQSFTVTDSNGNAYRTAIQLNETGDGDTFAIFYAENIAGGANTIRVSDTVSATLRVSILEYSGVMTSGSLDVAAAAQGNSAFPNSGSATTTANGDLLLGAIMTSDPATFTAGSGYKIEQSVPAEPNTKLIAEDQIQTTAGATSAGTSLGTAQFWAAGLAAFKPAVNGGSSASGSVSSLLASTTTVNFGNVNIGRSSSQTITLSDSGIGNVAISNVSISGAGVGASGVYVGQTLTPGQTVTLHVTFAPAATGSVSGSVTVTSNAADSPTRIAVSGAGLQAVHSVDLVWNGVTGVVGYNVYRGSVSGGPYTIISNTPSTTTTFTDTNVQSGQTYYYAVTSVNLAGVQSTLSNLASATIP